MNERIKELASQVLDEKFSGTWSTMDMQDLQKFAERFSELIVRECAALAKSKSEYIQSMETDDRGDQMQIRSLAWQFEEFGYKIKKHFGVEDRAIPILSADEQALLSGITSSKLFTIEAAKKAFGVKE